MLIRGVELAVERLGEGPRMLWCHGLTSSRAREDQRDLFGGMPHAISAAGLELIRYDARGHGRSQGTPEAADYGWDRLAGDALALHHAVTGHTAEPWIVGGASMGAATTLHLAVSHPHLVRAMVLVIPPTAWETRAAQRLLYQRGAQFVRARGRAAYVAATRALPPIPLFAGQPDHGRFEPDITDDLLATVLDGAASSDLPSPEELRSLSVPALILAWTGDPGHPVSTAVRLGELLGQPTLQVADTLSEVSTWGDRVAAFAAGSPS